MIMARVHDKDEMDNVVNRAEKKLRNVRDLEEGKEDFSVQSFADALETFTSVLNIIVGFIFLIVIISAIVASVNTANTMITSVLERTREIGVMKSIGATNDNIKNIFILESAVIGFVAGFFGVVVGWLLAYSSGQALDGLGWGFLMPTFPLALWTGCILLSTLVGMFSGFVPAYYASKQKPVEALRYE
jgi:putative ABC transport system permease protein